MPIMGTTFFIDHLVPGCLCLSKVYALILFQVNSRATLMFSGFLGDEVHENIFWPDLPYVTDEHASKFSYFGF